MKIWNLLLVLALAAGILVACGGDRGPSVDEQANSAQVLDDSAGGSYTSTALEASYENALPASSQLALGTCELEGTENAVTAEQAKTLLPLWQAIQGGSLQSDAETNAVLKQIEAAMTAEQLAAIAAMQLTMEDLGSWMQKQGVSMAPPANATGTPGGFAPPGGMSDEERAAMQATRQAGGQGGFPPGGFADMSEEERAAMRATAEASGMTFGSGRGPAGARSGQLTMLAAQVVEELLAQRAAG